jgi:hypothetical protein
VDYSGAPAEKPAGLTGIRQPFSCLRVNRFTPYGTGGAHPLRMRSKRALVFVALVAMAIAGLPVRVGLAAPGHDCCAAMAACCQMAPASPSTPARTPDVQDLSAQQASGHIHTAPAVVTVGAVPVRLSDPPAQHVRLVVLRI